jgi:glycosyltransferase involved in cell wall biosynthesis
MKQPELFLELARLLPDTRFRMIGGASVDREYYEQIKNEAEKIPNLAFTGFVPPGDVQKYYENAMVIINTSLYEGFPNTFLEAWSNAIPVVSLNVDPDEIICDKNLGIHSKNPDQLLLDVKKLVRDRPLRETLGMNGKNYLEDEHSAESVVSHYEKVFDRLMSSPE